MVNKEAIDALLFRYFENALEEEPLGEDSYVIAVDGSVQVSADVGRKRSAPYGILPVKFSHIDGDFLVPEMKLTSLINSPQMVDGMFDCSHNQLTNLTHSPHSVIDFDCSHNQLTNLAGCPAVPGELVCNNNLLTSLESCPQAAWVWAVNNPFMHFRNTPSHIDTVHVTWYADLPLLGLLVVKNIGLIEPDTGEEMKDLEQIMNRYAGQGRQGSLACAAELSKAGFKENARW
jgi:hypothetical protein